MSDAAGLERVAVLNHPSATSAVEWTAESMARLRDLGFTSVQLNLAWGPRPADEPLNLEDLIAVPEHVVPAAPHIAHSSDQGRRERWCAIVRRRFELASAAGLRTVLMAGLPYNMQGVLRGRLPHCISDPATADYYEAALALVHEEIPADDLWMYTYDNDA